MNTLTDNAIMLQIKAGDMDRMGLLFERHNRKLYGFLYHMTYDREASEDMVQMTFYKMLKYRHTFTGDFNFLALLAGMRVKKVKCFCLCGMYNEDITSGVAIGSNKSVPITTAGSLSFFANDTAGYYGNNSGSIDVNITRLK